MKCDMCKNEAVHKYVCNDKRIMDVCSVCYTIISTSEQVQKLKQYWVDKYNELHEQINDITEAQRLKITFLEKQLNEISGKYAQLSYVHNLERQLKNALAQVDLNAQTLEELK